jgi:hypothetical protein
MRMYQMWTKQKQLLEGHDTYKENGGGDIYFYVFIFYIFSAEQATLIITWVV